MVSFYSALDTTITDKTQLSENSVRKAIRELEQAGAITKREQFKERRGRRYQNSHLYTVMSEVIPLVHQLNHPPATVEPPSFTSCTTLVQRLNHLPSPVEPKLDSLNINSLDETQLVTSMEPIGEAHEGEPMISAYSSDTSSEDYEERPIMPEVVPQVFYPPKIPRVFRRRDNA